MNRRSASKARSRPGRAPSASAPLSRAAQRLLAVLGEEGASAAPDPTRDGFVILQVARAGLSLGRGAHAEAAVDELHGHDLVERGARGRATISEAGRSHLRRLSAGEGTEFQAQHRDLVAREIPHDVDGTDRVVVNAVESPLSWLRRRRDRDGEPLIDAAAFEAGERLRRDLTAAAMLPSVTARWEGGVGGGTGSRNPAAASDAVVAARQRARSALAAVGSDMAGLLLDLCGFLKGLELIERERGWPPRSGKVVVRLALRQLARHYGLETEAQGPDVARRLRTWIAEEQGAEAA